MSNLVSRRSVLRGAAFAALGLVSKGARAAPAARPPVLFLSHAVPVFGINDLQRIAQLRAWGEHLTKPRGIVVMTPHFGARQIQLGSTDRGFAMYDLPLFLKRRIPRGLDYPTQPSRDLAVRVDALVGTDGARAPGRPGFDHTTWALRRAKKELLANVSHELRTPLARVRVVVELAAEEDPETAKRYLADIADDVVEVEQILDNIITTARLDIANEQSHDPFPHLRLARIPLSSLVEALARRVSSQQPQRTLGISMDPSLVVDVDRIMLKHAISNLIDNAAKYSSPDAPIELSTLRSEDGRRVLIAVSDRGRGIAAHDLPHVFDPFFRVDRSRARTTGGVGLGLTLAKRIVEAHGGEITISSRLDAGTCVTISLSLDPTEAAQVEAPALDAS